MKEISINNVNYMLIKNEKDAYENEAVSEKLTDYFNEYDYVVGDWAYGKLRLKGFNKKTNKNFNNINDYSRLDDYIRNNCAFGCKYFVLEKK